MGTSGSAWSEDDGERLYLQGRDEPARHEVAVEPVDTLAEQVEEFVRCIRSGERPETGGQEGVEVVAAVEAVEASAASGRPADVADFRG